MQKRLTFDSMQKYRILYFLARMAQYIDIEYVGTKQSDEVVLNLI